MKTSLLAMCAAALLPAVANAQALPEPAASNDPDANQEGADADSWDISAPPGFTFSDVPIDVSEGSWIDLDVSPDGRTIAFALLGDIYTMPMTGGKPTRIAKGLAWEVQPRFSPDGRRIAFTSDRGGGDNIWLMNADGSDMRQVSKEKFRLLTQPTWSPDGQFIAARKHFTTQRSAGTGEIWLYHVSGGAGVPLIERSNPQFQKELGEPAFAPEGEAIYYTRNTTPGNTFEYAQDSLTGIFAIERYDVETGEVTTAVSGYGGAISATPSPDGTHLAFIRREEGQSKLFVKNLETGAQRQIYGALDLDLQETWGVTGLYPKMAWTPDNSSVVFWAGGQINRVSLKDGQAQVIPFRISDTRQVAKAPHPVVQVSPDTVTTNMVKFASLSPDGRTVVFESLGRLWLKPVNGSEARPLTREQDALEAFPAWSRDGRRIAFVRWSDEMLGNVVTVDANGRGERVVTQQPGHYARPVFSPDGKTILVERREGGWLTRPEGSDNPGIYAVATAGGTPRLIERDGFKPQFAASDERFYFQRYADEKLALVSADLNGEAERTHAEGELVVDYTVSPDGRYLAFRQNYEAFAMPLLPGTQAVNVDSGADALPIVNVSRGGAEYIHWGRGGDTLNWSMGPQLFSAALDQLFPDAPRNEGEKASFAAPTSGLNLAMTVPADKHRGTVALVGAKILTMAGENAGRAIQDGVIVIEGERIVAIGPRGQVAIPDNARQIDVTGKVIMPGLVDAHAHGPYGTGDLIPQQNWTLVQNLALGTTTMHDPSSTASEVFAASERQRAGTLLAPRLFSTGEIIYGAKSPSRYAAIDSYEDALDHVRRIKAQGGISVKNYNQPRRDQRQQVVRAALEENMLVVAEGGSQFGMDMALVADGNSTLEHNVPLQTFYDDVLQFFGASDTNYTPTLVVTYGGLAGDPYWRQATNVWENPLLVHTPRDMLLADTARREAGPDWAFVDDENAREAKKLADRGVEVAIGAHGQQPGIAAHWELWSFARGGMSPIEALETGTIAAARSLGMERDIGSLEVGKLADLLVLDADPSEDIRNSDKIAQVMLGGRLYDAATMNEVTTGDSKRRAYWWE